MKGKTCLITGATAGIGLETATELASMQAHVVISGRDAGKLKAAVSEIRKRVPEASLDTLLMDLGDQASVRQAAEAFLSKYSRLDVLVNNAGAVYSTVRKSPQGYELQWATNHLGHFLLTNLLLDALKNAGNARIVHVSSAAHYSGKISWESHRWEWDRNYKGLVAYSQTKLANVLFSNELARRYASFGITSNALHPGVVRTRIGNKDGNKFFAFMWSAFAGLFGISVAKGARTSVYLASSTEVEGVTGKYFTKCREKDPSALSKNTQLAQQVWDVSMQQCGITA